MSTETAAHASFNLLRQIVGRITAEIFPVSLIRTVALLSDYSIKTSPDCQQNLCDQ